MASMGPRSNDRGNLVGDYRTGDQNPLQWGRDQMIAEMLAGVDFVISTNVLQWGRDQMIAEIYAACRAGADLNWLQWGRDQMMAEIAKESPACVNLNWCFNGAASK